jgi:hypothetical protein
MRGFMSVYVGRGVSEEAVRAAVAELPMPCGVENVHVDSTAFTELFDCRIAVELSGTFEDGDDGRDTARSYGLQLQQVLGVPTFTLYDLLRLRYEAS